MRNFICFMFLWFGLMATPAHAQFGDQGGLGGILEEILGGAPSVPADVLVDNIPVTIEMEGTVDITGKMLVVTAYAPAATSGAFSKPDMLGQTQLLLTGLRFPLNVVIAVPKPVTDDIEFARLEAKIIDTNGNPVWTGRDEQFYRGRDPVVFDMVRSGGVAGETTSSSQSPLSLETINGTVRLSGKSDLFMGSMLTVQLAESGLAGGLTTTIAAETLIDLDQRKPPFSFKLERGVFGPNDDISYALNAWITDWAGRKTHIMERPVPYNGPERDYELTLDTYSMSPPPLDDLQTLPSQVIVKGVARFDAYKGLPAGCRLTATLSRSIGAPGTTRALATQTILLDGLSGDVDFDLIASNTDFDPLIPAPHLDIRITDSQGRLFFSAANVPAREGSNVVQLMPSAAY